MNITPLPGVAFILLFFFLSTANISRGFELDLPDASTAEIIPGESLEISITQDETILFNGVAVKKERLESILAAEKPGAQKNGH